MASALTRARDYSHVALAGVRLFNGAAALLRPDAVARRLGADPEADPATLYALRLFGVRTVLIAGELLIRDRRLRAWSRWTAPVIHASDTAAAAIAGMHGGLPRRTSVMIVAISAVNTVLALLALRPRRARLSWIAW